MMNEYNGFFHDYIKAGSLDTSQSELEKLGQSSYSRVRARVAENPMTPTATLRMLATDDDIEVRAAVASNRSTPRSIVWQIADSECIMTRLALAEEPNVPVSILEKLTCDENPYVAAEASKTLHVLNECNQSRIPSIGKDNIRDFKNRLSSKVS